MAILIPFIFLFFFLVLIMAEKMTSRQLGENEEDTDNEISLHMENWSNILLHNSTYFTGLSEAGRKKFLFRLKKMIDVTRFESMDEMELTEEMVVLIAAMAVQLTFGYKYYYLSNYDTIYVYPDSIYSPQTGNYYSGKTTTGHTISISWKNFIEGNENRSDCIHVGLHEMAHALEFSFLYGEKYDNSFADYYDSLLETEKEEMLAMKEGKATGLREYAGTNVAEFFAVCVEYFFEDPLSFKSKKPELYDRLSLLLNQDPLNTQDYILNKDRIEQKYNRRYFGNRNWHWSLTIICVGLFFSPLALFYGTIRTLISLQQIILFVGIAGILSAVFQLRYFRKNCWIGYPLYFLYSFAGIGISMVAILAILNQSVTIGQTYKTCCRIVQNAEYVPSSDKVEVEIQFPGLKDTRKVEIPYYMTEFTRDKFIYVKLKKGLLGFNVISDVWPVSGKPEVMNDSE